MTRKSTRGFSALGKPLVLCHGTPLDKVHRPGWFGFDAIFQESWFGFGAVFRESWFGFERDVVYLLLETNKLCMFERLAIIRMAREMLSEGLPMEKVVRMTRLLKEKVEEIA